ncbi:MAG TPA: hypothetical protein DCS63_06855 [Elusimicrobia bacterium]|nr:hypothetical protein [Elusimicrobiota bacterium]
MAIFKARTWALEETTDGPRVVIPTPFLWPISIFMGFWLCGWTAGEVSAAKALWQLARSADSWPALLPGGFLLFWLAGWTAAGFFTWGAFLFSIQGREVVSLSGDKLRVRLQTLLGLEEAGAKDLLHTLSARFGLPRAGEPELQKEEQ